MSRVICISNRVSLPDPATGKIKAGGLAVGVKAALESNRGGIWFGWDGSICKAHKKRNLQRQDHGNITFLTLPFRQKEYEEYYKGMANENLWPLMHGLGQHIEARKGVYQTYKEVNRLFARLIKPHLKPGDVLWVHDYHLIPLGKELRALGVRHAIGYFHHIPFPSRVFLNDSYVPPFLKRHYEELLENIFSYDLVGLQSFRDFRNFSSALYQQIPCPPRYKTTTVQYKGKQTDLGVFPISIETQDIVALAKQSALKAGINTPVNPAHKTLIGAERLDYTKGLVHRLKGFYEFLKQNTQYSGQINYQQITPLSRADIAQYKNAIEQTRSMVQKIQNDFGDTNTPPLTYSENAVPREKLMTKLRRSDVGLVTPIIDGQNLVAKEYIAAQDPRNPGVLVLSKTAGAAEELEQLGALCVEPTNSLDIAQKIKEALAIPRLERIESYRRAISYLHQYDIEHWTESFLNKINEIRQRRFGQSRYIWGVHEKRYNL